MGKPSKATKKFQSKHLKRTLDQRRREKQYKKKLQSHRGNKSEKEKRDALSTADVLKARQVGDQKEGFEDQPIDEFFEDEMKIAEKSKKTSEKKRKNVLDNDGSSSSESEHSIEGDMARISERDPEFYKYLQENDKDLLDFGGSKPLDGVENSDSDDSQVRGEAYEEMQPEESENVIKTELTLKLVNNWRDELHSSPHFKTIRNVVSAFKTVINMNNDQVNEKDHKYFVSDELAFKELLFVALRDLPSAIERMIPYRTKHGSRTLPSGTNVSKMSSLVKFHAPSLLVCLNDIFNTETAALVLQSVNQLLPYLISYRRVLKEIFKAVIEIWATTRDIETQIATFAFLISSSKEYKKALLEAVLKIAYSTFIKNCRKTDMHTMPLINFQKNSASELFAIDERLGYQVAFDYIRQLAIHLRNTMIATTKKTSKHNPAEAYKIVYNWQFCHSLDLWSRVLSLACNFSREKGRESPMAELIYPLVQVTLGVIRLIPAPQFFPLRFYLIRSLIRLSQNTGVYIPIFPLLLEILNSNAFTKVLKKKESLEAFDFDHNIKATKQYLGTRIYQEGLAEQFVDILGEYFVLYCKSISFPELVTPAVIALRRFIKTSKNTKYTRRLSNIIEKLNQNSSYIEQKRSKVEFGPTNKAEVARFLNDVAWEKTPLGAYIVVQREVNEEKVRILRESMEKDREEEKKAQDYEDDKDKALEFTDGDDSVISDP